MDSTWIRRKCKVCGKRFDTIGTQWAFQITRRGGKKAVFYCSWSCLRKDETENDIKTAKSKKGRG